MDIDFDPADAVAVGTVGPPGQRAFYIQARAGLRTLTLLVEKVQVQALAERANELLEDRPAGGSETPDDLVEPVEPDWRAGQLGLGIDKERDQVVMVAQEASGDEEDETEAEEGRLTTARFWMRPGQLRAWAVRAQELVAAGRPLCALCGLPMDAEGHVCPRKNGKSPVF